MHAYLGPQAFFAHHINNIIITIELMAKKVFCALLYWQLLYKLSFFPIDFYINFFLEGKYFPLKAIFIYFSISKTKLKPMLTRDVSPLLITRLSNVTFDVTLNFQFRYNSKTLLKYMKKYFYSLTSKHGVKIFFLFFSLSTSLEWQSNQTYLIFDLSEYRILW
jgi:hypothetical protein